jgi:hypothetical protein
VHYLADIVRAGQINGLWRLDQSQKIVSDRANRVPIRALGTFGRATWPAALIELFPRHFAPLADARDEIEPVPAGAEIGWWHFAYPLNWLAGLGWPLL